MYWRPILLLPSSYNFFSTQKNDLIIYFKVIPNSKKNYIVEINNDFIKVKLTAMPIENKANCALIKYLSKLFNISKSSFQILVGEKNKYKSIKISNLTQDKLLKILNNL